MRNKLTDLNNILFECIERLEDDSLSSGDLDKEIKKCNAIQKIARNIIDNASVALEARKHFDEYGMNEKVAIPLLGIGEK